MIPACVRSGALGAGLSVVVFASAFATAEEPVPATRLEVTNTFGAMVNVVGFEDILDVVWKRSLSRSSSPLVKDAHLSLGLTNTFSPAYDRVGAWVEVSPLSIVDLRVGFEPTLYFGLFNSLQDFPSYGSPFDERTRKDTNDGSYLGFARRVYVAPTVKMKVGPVIAFSGAEIEWWKAEGDGPHFYEPARDTLLESRGDRVFRTSSGLLFELRGGEGRKFLLGPWHQLTDVEGARANRVQRVGLLGVYELGGRRLGLRRPTLIGQLAYYVDDPFKKNEPWALLAVRWSPRGH
jgi:hypothetical protein